MGRWAVWRFTVLLLLLLEGPQALLTDDIAVKDIVSPDATGGDGGSGEPPECAYGKVTVRPLRPRDPVPVPGLLKEISITHLGGM